jgi:hypothetical protein
VIVEALYRHLVRREAARELRVRFGANGAAEGWRSLRRWRAQLLVSPTLWGWLGKRLGVRRPAVDRQQGRRHLERLLAEIGLGAQAAVEIIRALPCGVRATLSGLVHNRLTAWSMGQFRPGRAGAERSGANTMAAPTEKGSGRAPPG